MTFISEVLDRQAIHTSVSSARTVPVHTQDLYRFFGAEKDLFPYDAAPATPFKIVIITSVRDIGGDDRVGSHVRVRQEDGTHESRYMEGAIEGLLRLTAGPLGQFFQIEKVIVDDVPNRDRVEDFGYSILPCPVNDNWLVPSSYRSANGTSIVDMVESHPSDWRKLPIRQQEERALQKEAYERHIEQRCLELGADIILSDHLIMRLEHLHKGAFKGRVLNIHPGITWEHDPMACRGLHPTQDALDKAGEFALQGQEFSTGASLHYIADEIDLGHVICDGARTVVNPAWDASTLRWENYQRSKINVLAEGLKHFVANIDHFDRHFRNN